MFVATDWYYTSQQNGGVLGYAPGDLLTVFPALGIAFFGISVPLLLQGSEKYKTRVKMATALLISISVASAQVLALTTSTPTCICDPTPTQSPTEAPRTT